jgi:hypothetical protein
MYNTVQPTFQVQDYLFSAMGISHYHIHIVRQYLLSEKNMPNITKLSYSWAKRKKIKNYDKIENNEAN